MARVVAVVPHTHWDREWYATFESYRVRLVSMMDQLLDLLESHPEFEHFHLDGQVALIDDYLAIRPESGPRVAALIGQGRLAIGPWYVLMDEFCVSAETIVRNLQMGLTRARSLGADPAVGYLPDMFGHAAQMPQILCQAGLEHAVVWRGVPAAVTDQVFTWSAPSGDRVRAQYLPVGYANGAFLPKSVAELIDRVEAHETEIGGYLGPEGDLLLMNGGDHQFPQAWMPDLLDAANRAQDHFRFRQASLAGFLTGQPAGAPTTWAGELRSGARAPVLMGVLSNRVDVKQAAHRTTERLERLAEPLAALWLPPALWPADLLDGAWLEVIRNSAHDSICACSTDEVVRAVRHRYDTALALAATAVDAGLAIAGVATAAPGTVIVNPLPFDRGGLVETTMAGHDVVPGAQVLSSLPAGQVARHGLGADLAAILGRLAEEGWLGPSGRGVAATLESTPAGLMIDLVEDATKKADPAMAAVMAEAWARAGAGRAAPLTVRVSRRATQKVVARVEDVPGWGWAMYHPVAGREVAVRLVDGGIEVANGLTVVVVDTADGTFSVDGVAGHNAIVEEADEGDTYNFSPGSRPPVSAPLSVTADIVEAGPVRAVVRVCREYGWSPGAAVVSDVSVGAGESVVRVTTSFDHYGRDHRVRAVFPLGTTVATTVAECAFATVERGQPEGGPQEPALATYPSRRFVTAGPLSVTHEGLLEHELIDGGRALAVTLLRATGILSRPAPAARPNVAGPALALRDSQMPGPQEFRYALARDSADPWALADAVWTPLMAVPAEGDGPLPDRGRRLTVIGARVSSLRRVDGALEVRVFNPTDQATTVSFPAHSGDLVDLTGRSVGGWDGAFPLGPWAFATARLAARSLD
ncbi:MAG TPA: hypothetical protein VG435_04730 [Acidimicrobiales bacterium]|jgi:hypothetical protein|nr:hypothetical protein [Acidimicrobiales bacterium]